MLQCPKCLEDIHLGYAGYAATPGFKKLPREYGQKGEGEETAEIVYPVRCWSTENDGSINNPGVSQPPPLLKVGPSLESPVPIQDLSNDLKGVVKRKGCGEAWNLLEKLSDRVEELEINQDIPVANVGDELEGYNKETAKAMCDGVNAEEVWETVNPFLDWLLGFGKSKEDIRLMLLRRGEKGLRGLHGFLHISSRRRAWAILYLKGK